MEGNSYNGIYAYKWAGLSETGEPQIYDKDGNITTTDYTDLEAIHYVGTTVPEYSGSFTNVFNYKDFELSIQMLYAGGHKIRNTNIPKINMGDPYSNGIIDMTSKDIRKRWKQAEMKRSRMYLVCFSIRHLILITIESPFIRGQIFTCGMHRILRLVIFLLLIRFPMNG